MIFFMPVWITLYWHELPVWIHWILHVNSPGDEFSSFLSHYQQFNCFIQTELYLKNKTKVSFFLLSMYIYYSYLVKKQVTTIYFFFQEYYFDDFDVKIKSILTFKMKSAYEKNENCCDGGKQDIEIVKCACSSEFLEMEDWNYDLFRVKYWGFIYGKQ